LGEDSSRGAFIEDLKSIAAELGVEHHIEFLGFRPDVENVLADFDILVIPSRSSMPEGLPLTALEGLAAGCLVVATVNSGLPEVVRDGKTGFLVPPDDPKTLAASIVKALTLPEDEQRRIRQTARELVADQFSIEQQVIRLGQLYRELAS
jgi:glycosyltransferase involved in cell wall biosynthesis